MGIAGIAGISDMSFLASGSDEAHVWMPDCTVVANVLAGEKRTYARQAPEIKTSRHAQAASSFGALLLFALAAKADECKAGGSADFAVAFAAIGGDCGGAAFGGAALDAGCFGVGDAAPFEGTYPNRCCAAECSGMVLLDAAGASLALGAAFTGSRGLTLSFSQSPAPMIPPARDVPRLSIAFSAAGGICPRRLSSDLTIQRRQRSRFRSGLVLMSQDRFKIEVCCKKTVY